VTSVVTKWFVLFAKYLLFFLHLAFLWLCTSLILFFRSLGWLDIVAWLNFVVLLLSSFLSVYYYVKSVSPARLEKQRGGIAYRKCGRYRIISCLSMIVIVANYILYYFFPLPIPPPQHLPPHILSPLHFSYAVRTP